MLLRAHTHCRDEEDYNELYAERIALRRQPCRQLRPSYLIELEI